METLAKPEKSRLLQMARKAIERRVLEGRLEIETSNEEPFNQPAGAFVTLHKRGELRGCIGRIEAVDPLEIVVQEMAVAAAVRDPRFSPVGPHEIEHLEIEISILSPTWEIQSIEEIEVGLHGLIISAEGRKGLLLPQVATENAWDRETFLTHTCLKAGLSPDYWRTQSITMEIFSSLIISETEI